MLEFFSNLMDWLKVKLARLADCFCFCVILSFSSVFIFYSSSFVVVDVVAVVEVRCVVCFLCNFIIVEECFFFVSGVFICISCSSSVYVCDISM